MKSSSKATLQIPRVKQSAVNQPISSPRQHRSPRQRRRLTNDGVWARQQCCCCCWRGVERIFVSSLSTCRLKCRTVHRFTIGRRRCQDALPRISAGITDASMQLPYVYHTCTIRNSFARGLHRRQLLWLVPCQSATDEGRQYVQLFVSRAVNERPRGQPKRCAGDKENVGLKVALESCGEEKED